VDVWLNQTGRATVTVISGSKIVSATFAPNQIAVSMDLGDTSDAPHYGARGVGFSSLINNGFEPSYPLGIEDGAIDWGDFTFSGNADASQALQAVSLDLMHNAGYSGRAWPCVGFPSNCAAPNPLHTDKGDLLLYYPYSLNPDTDYPDSLSAGLFTVLVGPGTNGQGSAPSSPLLNQPGLTSANPITYYASVITDVTLGRNHYPGAQVYLSMDADTSTVVPFGSHGFKNATGNAHVAIVTGTHIVTADFNPGQIYVYHDVDHASVGFGSTTGSTESGYPLSITANSDDDGLVNNSLVGAVSDLTLTPANAANYTAATATLSTNLKSPTTLSGAASSCIGFDPTTSTCSTQTPIALKTNRGDFLISQPYLHEALDNTTTTYSINWGVFWAQTASGH